jgi:hypothetical protein
VFGCVEAAAIRPTFPPVRPTEIFVQLRPPSSERKAAALVPLEPPAYSLSEFVGSAVNVVKDVTGTVETCSQWSAGVACAARAVVFGNSKAPASTKTKTTCKTQRILCCMCSASFVYLNSSIYYRECFKSSKASIK